MKLILITLILLPIICIADNKLYFNNGKSLEGKILEANETHVKIARAKDLQQFRFPVKLLTIDSRKQIELYHSKDRYSSIPASSIPLDDRSLSKFTNYIDQLIDNNLRSKRLQKTKELDEYSYARRLYLTTIGRIPTVSYTHLTLPTKA